MKIKICTLILFICILSNVSFSQWANIYNYGIDSTDNPNAMAIDQFGYTYVVGSSFSTNQESNYILIKYNLSGDTVWTRQYNGNISGEDYANSVSIDNQSNVIVTGASESITGYDILTLKYNSSGSLLWEKRYNGLGSGNNIAFFSTTDDSLNVYISGKIQISTNVTAISTIKYNKDGVQQWIKQFNGNSTGNNIPNALAVNKNTGNIYITGYISTLNQGKDIVILKYNRNGSLMWQKTINGLYNGDDVANAIMIDSSENVYISGYITTGANNNVDFITAKYSTSGDSIWVKYYSGAGGGADISRAITVDNQGNCYVTGESFAGVGLVNYEIVTICYSSSGLQKWISHYNKNNNCCIHKSISLASDNNGNIIAGGSSTGDNNFNDFIVLKYNVINGNQNGIYRYRFPGTNNNDVKAMATDNSGNCYLTGIISSNGALNIGTLKISNSSIGIRNTSENIQSVKFTLVNYPNPFNPSTIIKFTVSENGKLKIENSLVTLKIFNVLGKEVATLINDKLHSGLYEIKFDGSLLPSGIYFCKLISNNFTDTKKIILLK